ncbi:MAG: sigma 54-interacting transcriptional regulator [Kofleriaceae bacterium]
MEQSHEQEVATLVMIAICDRLAEPSSRHVLTDLDEVRFGRGERSATRKNRVLELQIPDGRMSKEHGRLVRTDAGWQLSDPSSKNGSAIDGVSTREGLLSDDAVLELGNTFFLFRIDRCPVADTMEDELPGHPALRTFDGTLTERFAALETAARDSTAILISGEPGSGKEVVAQAIHDLSGRTGSLVTIDCGALTADRVAIVRSANHGTLFLDEIDDLPLDAQQPLARALAEVDVRLCAASQHSERDGYGFVIRLAPLRARMVDLGMLLRRILAPHPATVEPAAMRALLQHDWPLNIRELEKVTRTASALSSGAIGATHLPTTLHATPVIGIPAVQRERAQQDARRARIVELLVAHRGDVEAVAHALDSRRTQVERWLRRYDLDPATFRT